MAIRLRELTDEERARLALKSWRFEIWDEIAQAATPTKMQGRPGGYADRGPKSTNLPDVPFTKENNRPK